MRDFIKGLFNRGWIEKQNTKKLHDKVLKWLNKDYTIINLMVLFDLIDKDRDGWITGTELLKYCKGKK